MPKKLPAATAEQVISAVEAAIAGENGCSIQFAAQFSDMTEDRAGAALELAVELGLLKEHGQTFRPCHPLAPLLRSPQVSERAAVMRIVIEQYKPFVVFRQELDATDDASLAATRTKAVLDLAPHREDVKSTLLGLATFSGALKAGTGGKYERDVQAISASLNELAAGATETAAAVLQIRETLGGDIANAISSEEVIGPLGQALRHASGANAREAVVYAGNAIESFLSAFAGDVSCNITNANGLNAKLDRLEQAGYLPKKLLFVGKYLGHVRNAADHGVDAEIGQAWSIQSGTGLNYVYVALGFISAVQSHRAGLALI